MTAAHEDDLALETMESPCDAADLLLTPLEAQTLCAKCGDKAWQKRSRARASKLFPNFLSATELDSLRKKVGNKNVNF